MTIYLFYSFLSCIKAKQNSNRLETILLMATQRFCDIDSAFEKLLCIGLVTH
jgi:hypothetical protein